MNRYNLETIELLKSRFQVWNGRTANWDPPQKFSLIEMSFVDVKDPAERAYLNRLATSLSLEEQDVTRLRHASRDALRNAPGFRALVERLSEQGP